MWCALQASLKQRLGLLHVQKYSLTYEGLLLLIMTEAIAAWEESVGISVIKPWNILHVHTQTNLSHMYKNISLKFLKRNQTEMNEYTTKEILQREV